MFYLSDTNNILECHITKKKTKNNLGNIFYILHYLNEQNFSNKISYISQMT